MRIRYNIHWNFKAREPLKFEEAPSKVAMLIEENDLLCHDQHEGESPLGCYGIGASEPYNLETSNLISKK